MRAVEIVVVEVERKALSAVITGVIGTSVSPLAGDGLDEAFGLAIGLRPIGSGEEVFETQLETGGGKELGAIGRAAIGEDGLDGDAVVLIKSQSLLESSDDAGDFFVGKEGGKSTEKQQQLVTMAVNNSARLRTLVDDILDVERLDACPWVAMGTVAGGPDAGVMKTAKLFNIKMKEFTGSGAFVTHDRRLGRFERTQAVETMTFEDAGEGSF